ncbi:MAG: class I SAM-dependent methyltransferase [Proteobacteria bacterium]|nr:MAG: class I SAM-dependent methyltransferase [Pseudomonadota bacterium]
MSEADRHSYLSRRYGGSQSIMNRRERRMVAELLAVTGQPSRVLDLPCGHGRFTPQLRAATRDVVVCGDHNPKNISALLAAEDKDGTPLQTLEIDLFERLPFDNDSFDLVFNFRFFHHIFDDALRRHVILELSRVSRRFLIVSYYDDVWLHKTQKKLWRHRKHRRELPMVPRGQMHHEFAQANCRVISDRAVMPVVHAHRIALLEKFAESA